MTPKKENKKEKGIYMELHENVESHSFQVQREGWETSMIIKQSFPELMKHNKVDDVVMFCSLQILTINILS